MLKCLRVEDRILFIDSNRKNSLRSFFLLESSKKNSILGLDWRTPAQSLVGSIKERLRGNWKRIKLGGYEIDKICYDNISNYKSDFITKFFNKSKLTKVIAKRICRSNGYIEKKVIGNKGYNKR